MSAPRWARLLLRLCVPPTRREDVIGDLTEMHLRRRGRGGAVRAWLGTSAEALLVAGSFLAARCREGGGLALGLTWPEARLALRIARKQPLLNLAVVLALGAGIGLSAAAFTLVDTTFFGRLPLPAGERFVRVSLASEAGGASTSIEGARFELLASAGDVFQYLGVAADGSTNLLDADGGVEALRGVVLSADAFRVLPYRPVLGRTLRPSDGEPGAAPVVLVSERVWRRRFGSDGGVIGRAVDVAGAAHRIVGVMPDDAGFPNEPDVWLPARPRDFAGDGVPGRRGLVVFGVLREGVPLEAADRRAAALSAGFEAEHADAQRLRPSVRPFVEVPRRGMTQIFLSSLLTAVLAVVLVISANVGNLVAARAAARRAELGVRTALGASRSRLVAQIFGEVLVLGAAATLLAAWGLHRLMTHVTVWLAHDLPFWVDLMPRAATWAFMAVVALVACVVAGGLPAIRATRGAPGDVLRFAGRGGGTGFGRTASAMSVLQLAFSVALLGGALLAVRGMALYAGARPSIPAERILTAGMTLDRSGDAGCARDLLASVEAVAAGLPGVARSGFASSIPGVETPPEIIEVDPLPGGPLPSPRSAPVVRARPGFLEALGASPVLGRLLRPEDLAEGARPVAVVNESFVRKFLGGRNPLGRQVRILYASPPSGDAVETAPWREIVGVVPDLGLSVGDPEMEGGLYVPLTHPSWGYLVLSVPGGGPGAVADALRRTLAREHPDLPVPQVETLDRAGSQNAAALGLFGGLLSALGGMALLLSLVSTYALVSLTVTRRVREVGIRVALGASRIQVLRSVAGRAALQITAGAALGVPLGALLAQAKRLFVFRVPSGDPWVLPLVACLMVAAGALAGWLPARRALRVAPSEALRAE